MKWIGAVIMALLAYPQPVSAKSCPPEQVERIAALIRDARGDIHLILGTIRGRMGTEQVRCWAATGDRKMMTELGRRLETGDGISRDVERAEDLYKAAATPKNGTIWIYTPGVSGQPGRVISHRIGADEPGLPQAAYARAMMHIEGRAARPSYRKGLKLLQKLAESGYDPARTRYDAIMAGPRT
ncbi:SEL1-like repeat protein [Sphingomonas sp. KC8]|uniref:SEL1-like repeat protein n=1 Tax=Sphingomonas sp. KC8 TaxID=1030157 RepID=UPI0002489314|nr:SEL1-like repeat protein [Sphingomonas sp. KC8]ARS26637.1 hypothetical protein KC8_04955 [Sphingomonas sp. KC8]